MVDTDIDAELDKELEAALSAFDESEDEQVTAPVESGDNQDEQDQDDVDVEPAPQVEPETPAEPAAEPDFYTPEQLAALPKGSAIPMPRFQQLIEQRNRERQEAENLRKQVEELQRQSQAPSWMQQPPAWYGQQQNQQQPNNNGLPDWLNPDDMDPHAYNAFMWQHQQQQALAQQLEAQKQQAQQFMQWQQQQQLAEQARRIETWANQVTSELPDVDDDFLYTQLQAGRTPEQAYAIAVNWQNKINGYRGTQRPQAPEPAPQPARSASGTASRNSASNGKKYDRTTEEGRKALLDSIDL